MYFINVIQGALNKLCTVGVEWNSLISKMDVPTCSVYNTLSMSEVMGPSFPEGLPPFFSFKTQHQMLCVTALGYNTIHNKETAQPHKTQLEMNLSEQSLYDLSFL